MTLKNVLISTLFFSSAIYAENSVGVDINQNDAEVFASMNLNGLVDYENGTTYILDLNYLRSNKENMARVGIFGQNRIQGFRNLTLGFGFKSVLADNFLAFPLMVKGAYELPLSNNLPTTSVSLSLAYAPSAFSFRDAHNYADMRLEASMRIISNIHLFAGYRYISTNYNDKYSQDFNDKTFNNSIYGGLKLSF